MYMNKEELRDLALKYLEVARSDVESSGRVPFRAWITDSKGRLHMISMTSRDESEDREILGILQVIMNAVNLKAVVLVSDGLAQSEFEKAKSEGLLTDDSEVGEAIVVSCFSGWNRFHLAQRFRRTNEGVILDNPFEFHSDANYYYEMVSESTSNKDSYLN